MLPSLRPVRVHIRVFFAALLAVFLYCSLPGYKLQARQFSDRHVNRASEQVTEQRPIHGLSSISSRPNAAVDAENASNSVAGNSKAQGGAGQHGLQQSTSFVISASSDRSPSAATHSPSLGSSDAKSLVEAVDGVVVMGKMSHEDTSWVKAELPEWQHAIYIVDANTSASSSKQPYTVPMNRGKESMPYLTYIIDHYDALPATLVFLHSHGNSWPQAWHTDAPEYSNAYTVRQLRRSYVQRQGYVNLRCRDEPGCPDEVQPFRDPPDLSEDKKIERGMEAAWKYIFGIASNVSASESGIAEAVMSIPPVPEVIAVPCCAQFAVARWQVRRRPREDYLRMRQWVMSTENEDPGRIMEYLWHIIFGQEPVLCPSMESCYKNVYGLDMITDVLW